MYKLHNGKIVDIETGEIVVKDPSPKFENWKADDYYKEFKATKEIRFLEPMTAKEVKQGQPIPTKGQIAEEKFDGHRALCYITSRGNRLFSRRISKKTNWYAENSDCLPHIRDFPTRDFIGTVLDGEITMATFADVQGVTGALPETALLNQAERGFAVFNAFDILYYRGINVQAMPLWKRKGYLARVISEINSPYIKRVRTYATANTLADYKDIVDEGVTDFKSLLEKTWERGGEGLIIKDLNGRYEQKRSNFFLKLKDCIYRDVVVMAFEKPTREFTGKTDLDKWEYWEGKTPVTKPYAKGWIGAVICGVYKDGLLKPVVALKGFTDDELEYIKQQGDKLFGEVLEVKAHQISDPNEGTLRHPRFSRWREDKSAEMCTWDDHIG